MTNSKVDRRVLKSREAIKQAVLELMSEKSFDDITIQDIADRANVNRGTIYLHYADKFDLLDKIIEEHIEEMRNLAAWACELDWIEATRIFFEYFEQHYLFFSTMLASKAAPSFRIRFLEYLIESFRDELAREGGGDPRINEDVMLRFVGTAYVGVVEWWITQGMPHTPALMAQQVGMLLEKHF
ncbi:TetR/AcrR family transcriptional regulator [Alicyclobacillus herbarius]|uniref:TetR/AcrR family transcriptional regulator n=1 Tax=Alicyclobacillus herbarius TaxID=122960 RepID=UPI00047DB6D9|nr:TetR/AcrR family transcriptional regulator [Alicyclobacillus herbarius]